MKTRIIKEQISVNVGLDRAIRFPLPPGAKFLSAACQDTETVSAWFEVPAKELTPDAVDMDVKEIWFLKLQATGDYIERPDPHRMQHLATAIDNKGGYVWHLYKV